MQQHEMEICTYPFYGVLVCVFVSILSELGYKMFNYFLSHNRILITSQNVNRFKDYEKAPFKPQNSRCEV